MTPTNFNSNNLVGTQLFDSTGQYRFIPDACSAAQTNNADGTPATVTLTDPSQGLSFTRTFTYDGSGNLTSYTGWVKQ